MATNKESSGSDSDDTDLVDLDSSVLRAEFLGLELYEGFALSKGDQDSAMQRIRQAAFSGERMLDLSSKGLLQLPPVLLKLPQLECLYLEANELTFLPDNFFHKLNNLKWLDLRQNKLTKLPAKGLAEHENLSHLLLAHNKLRSLPTDLGLVKSLVRLQISGNPLEFPPLEVVGQGEREVMKYLQHLAHCKRAGSKPLAGVQETGDGRAEAEVTQAWVPQPAPCLASRHRPLPPIGTSHRLPPSSPDPAQTTRPHARRPGVLVGRVARVDRGQQADVEDEDSDDDEDNDSRPCTEQTRPPR